jgi:hypothetical protein
MHILFMAVFIFHFAFAFLKLKCYTAWFITVEIWCIAIFFLHISVYVGMNMLLYLLAQYLPYMSYAYNVKEKSCKTRAY